MRHVHAMIKLASSVSNLVQDPSFSESLKIVKGTVFLISHILLALQEAAPDNKACVS